MMDTILYGIGLSSLVGTVVKEEAVVSKIPITFLGFWDVKTGEYTESGHPLEGVYLGGKVVVVPRSVGSTVGVYTLLNLVHNKVAPRAIINQNSDAMTVTGCGLGRIPLAYRFGKDPVEIIKTGDWVELTTLWYKGIVRAEVLVRQIS